MLSLGSALLKLRRAAGSAGSSLWVGWTQPEQVCGTQPSLCQTMGESWRKAQCFVLFVFVFKCDDYWEIVKALIMGAREIAQHLRSLTIIEDTGLISSTWSHTTISNSASRGSNIFYGLYGHWKHVVHRRTCRKKDSYI